MTSTHKPYAMLFDFMRTLYDPDRQELYLGTLDVLKDLSNHADLYLVTRLEGHRIKILKDLGIDIFFTDVACVDRKTQKHFKEFIREKDRGYKEVFCIGDVIWEEIAIGNKLGWKTIWVKRGTFSDVVPKHEEEMPWKSITDIRELQEIFKK